MAIHIEVTISVSQKSISESALSPLVGIHEMLINICVV